MSRPLPRLELFFRSRLPAKGPALTDCTHAYLCCQCYVPGDTPYDVTPGGTPTTCEWFPGAVLVRTLRVLRLPRLAARVPHNMSEKTAAKFFRDLRAAADDLRYRYEHRPQSAPKPPGWFTRWDSGRRAWCFDYGEPSLEAGLELLEDAAVWYRDASDGEGGVRAVT